MRRLMIAVPAIMLMMTMVALAQQAPGGPSAKPADDKAAADKAATDKSQALEQLLGKALQNSPDVQVAEARLKEAEAALRQARMLVAQKTVELQQSIDQKQQVLSSLETQYKRISQLRSAGTVPAAEVNKIESELAAQKAQIAAVEAQVNMLIGKLPILENQSGQGASAALAFYHPVRRWQGDFVASGGGFGGGGGGDATTTARMPHAATADRLRKLLNTSFKVPESNENVPLPDLISQIRATTGAPILTKIGEEVAKIDFKGEVTLAAYFQMLCDSVPNLSIFVRDYGFLITADPPPDDAMSFMDFLRSGEKSNK